MKRWRQWVAAPLLFLLRESLVLSARYGDYADYLWHRLRWWALGRVWCVPPKVEGQVPPSVDILVAARIPAYAHDVTELPGGIIHDYSRELGEDEGWLPGDEDPLANAPGCLVHGFENCPSCQVPE